MSRGQARPGQQSTELLGAQEGGRAARVGQEVGGLAGYGLPNALLFTGCYPARAGGLWLWRILVRSGFQAVVVPSGLRTRVQPQRWITI
jgi:hypothetical protein